MAHKLLNMCNEQREIKCEATKYVEREFIEKIHVTQ